MKLRNLVTLILVSIFISLLIIGCGSKDTQNADATQVAQDKATIEALATSIINGTQTIKPSDGSTSTTTPTSIQRETTPVNDSAAPISLQNVKKELPGIWKVESEDESRCAYMIIFDDLTFREQIDEDFGRVVIDSNSILLKYDYGEEYNVIPISEEHLLLQDHNGNNFQFTKLPAVAETDEVLQQSITGLWVSKKGTTLESDIEGAEIIEYAQGNKVYHVYSIEGKSEGGRLWEFTPLLRTAVQEYTGHNSYALVIDQIWDNSLSFMVPYSCDSVVTFTKIAGISNLPEAIIGSWEIQGHYDYDLGSSIEFTREGIVKSNVYGEFPYSIISNNTIVTTIDGREVFWNVVDLTDSTVSLSYFGTSYLFDDVRPTEYLRR